MRDPELRSPQEWVDLLRVMAAACDVNDADWCIQPADCRELADRMDDLSEALRLLRDYHEGGLIVLPRHEEAGKLLAKYEAEED